MRINEELLNDDKSVSRKFRKKLEDAFDVNYAVSEILIDSMESFEKELLSEYKKSNGIYYRGERINSNSRRLVPTILRKETDLFRNKDIENVINIDSNELYSFYCSQKYFMTVYETIYGEAQIEKMYNMMAFAQHYLDVSPFIDFSKSLYVAISFALKGRVEVNEDIVIYTAFDIGDDDTSTDINEVNLWLENYNVNLINTVPFEELKQGKIRLPSPHKITLSQSKDLRQEIKKIETFVNGLSPSAKLIDIPTNDLMKYQQGVFLLLNDFSLVDMKYLTKTVRQNFVINKYVISKSICPQLRKLLLENAPQYRYECLMNITKAVKG